MNSELILPRCTPESQGIPSTSLLAFIEDVEKNIHSMHSFMLLRHGTVVAEGCWAPYAPQHPHMLFSLSKSFTSTAVGLAVAEGCLSVDDPVLYFFPKEAPKEPGENLKAMRVKHLLSMSTGHDQDTTRHMVRRKNWATGFLRLPVEHEPGTHFVYNSGATYMLSAIVQTVTGQKVLEYLTPRLFEPLGIEGATWETCPRGVNVGGWGLKLKTVDIARFGQLYLQKGLWHGRQLLPAAWVAAASAKQVSNGSKPESDWEQGYGYQFWRCRHNIYRGDGAFGQYCIVMPDQDAVLAITSGVGDMQAVLNIVWDRLLPALGSAALPEDAPRRKALQRRLSGLRLEPAQGEERSPVVKQVSGKKYVFEQDKKNKAKLEWASLAFTGEGCTLTLRDARGEHSITCGSGAWRPGTSTLELPEPQPVAASGAWLTPDTYGLKVCYYETPFISTLTFRFTGDSVAVDSKDNVSFRPGKRPTLEGKLPG